MSFLNHYEPDTDIDETGAWLSIGDLMSGLVMLFALLLVVSLLLINEAADRAKDSRVVIIQALQETLKSAGINANIDPVSGDISIMDSVLFDSGSAELKPAGVRFLETFVPIYSRAIFSDEAIAEQIQFVVIEGHTSAAGGWDYNMDLSLKRANSVSHEISQMKFGGKDAFRSRLLVSGRGEAAANQAQSQASDRKVVFRFQFTGDQFLNWFINESGLGRG